MGKVVFENETTSFLRIAYPQPALASLIVYYFEVDASTAATPIMITGLPSVHTLIEIDLSSGHETRLLGHLTRPVTGSYIPGAMRFYAKLHPGSFTALFPFSPQRIQDSQEQPTTLLRNFSVPQFAELPSFRQRVKAFESYLLNNHYPLAASYKQQYVRLFINSFTNAQYCAPESIHHLCARHHITYASLRRYFQEQVGVSAKYCQKVIRFKSALRAYRTLGYQFNYTDFGYSDFSHFCKDARALTQKSPMEL